MELYRLTNENSGFKVRDSHMTKAITTPHIPESGSTLCGRLWINFTVLQEKTEDTCLRNDSDRRNGC